MDYKNKPVLKFLETTRASVTINFVGSEVMKLILEIQYVLKS